MKLLSNCESNEYLLSPTFTFGVIDISTLDESNIDDDILEEGVHAQKPTEIQNLAENMENTNLPSYFNIPLTFYINTDLII